MRMQINKAGPERCRRHLREDFLVARFVAGRIPRLICNAATRLPCSNAMAWVAIVRASKYTILQLKGLFMEETVKLAKADWNF